MNIDFSKPYTPINEKYVEYTRKGEKELVMLDVMKHEDIINSMKFDSPKDKKLCSDIINKLEEFAAIQLKNDKSIVLPYICNVRRNEVRRAVRNNNKAFKHARTHMDSKEYKEYVSEVLSKTANKVKDDNKRKFYHNRIKSKFKKKYDEYYLKFGRAYAEMFIKSIMMLESVEYNEELDNILRELKD